VDLKKEFGCINRIVIVMSQTKSSRPSFLNFALVAAVVGGVGAAVLSHPKGKQIRENLKDVGDDIVDVVEKTIDNVQGKAKNADPIDISDVVVSLFEELHSMNKAAAKDTTAVRMSVGTATEQVIEKVHQVEEKVEEVADDFSKKISWLQKTGRTLAKRGMKDF
jgi:gas vesicle protein